MPVSGGAQKVYGFLRRKIQDHQAVPHHLAAQHGILSQRLTEFILQNDYIDTSVQKGEIPGVPLVEKTDCLEHSGVITQLTREAREIWLSCDWS